MTMQYPFVLPCPICGETPKTYEPNSKRGYTAICQNCGFDFDNDDCDEPAKTWNNGVRDWYEKNIPPKVCPYCGNTGEEDPIITIRWRYGYGVLCEGCKNVGPFAATIPAALVAWNKQPEPEKVTTQDKEPECVN